MSAINNYDGYSYEPKSRESAEAGYILASIASAVVMGALPYASKPFVNQMKKEHSNNHLYKDVFYKAIENSGLKEKGLTFEHTDFSLLERLALGTDAEAKIVDKEIKAGLNACYIPDLKVVKLNAEKATISGFHELGHAMNHLNGKFGKLLQLCRKPGYGLAALMGTAALFSRGKPKGAKRDVGDVIQDNCGKIAFAALLPTVAEEALASHKGLKLAKQAGISDALLKNIRKFYGKALLSYVGYAVATGLSVFATSKIMEKFTRPKMVKNDYSA